MLAYGLSVAVGNLWGGRLADRRGPVAALKIVFALLTVVLVILHFTAPHPQLMVATVLAWGAVAFGNVPALQVYVVKQAQRFLPQGEDVASGLNIAAFNVGIAGGAWIGGMVVSQLGLVHTAWIGAIVVAAAWWLVAWSGRLDARDARHPAAPNPAPQAAAALAGQSC
jgi:DHA1 family inner membrane transport protein